MLRSIYQCACCRHHASTIHSVQSGRRNAPEEMRSAARWAPAAAPPTCVPQEGLQESARERRRPRGEVPPADARHAPHRRRRRRQRRRHCDAHGHSRTCGGKTGDACFCHVTAHATSSHPRAASAADKTHLLAPRHCFHQDFLVPAAVTRVGHERRAQKLC